MFSGISAPYEEPEEPECVIDTASLSVSESVAALMNYTDRHLGGCDLHHGAGQEEKAARTG